jgi:hypothetical protein
LEAVSGIPGAGSGYGVGARIGPEGRIKTVYVFRGEIIFLGRMRCAPSSLQLQLDFAAPPAPIRLLSPEDFLRALHSRRARSLQRVRFKNNRAQIITLSRDGQTLHIHACFREADEDALDAVSVFLSAGRRSAAYRDALHALREFWSARGDTGAWSDEDDARVIDATRRLPSSGTPQQEAFLRDAYMRFNAIHFDSRLPLNFPMRISDRMASRFGHMRYHTMRTGERIVLEIAVNLNLFAPGNEPNLLDTLLHEMTHVEAWLLHGHRAHGATWRRIARRVGCEPRACSARIIRRRRRGLPPLVRVPDAAWLPALAKVGAA